MVVNPADGTVAAPTDGESIPNIDSVKSTIRAYYNATGGIANKTSSRYITEVHGDRAPTSSTGCRPRLLPTRRVVFDVDDTLLWNYDFEDKATNFNFDPAINATWVTEHLFPAVPGMPGCCGTLKARGYALYGITGRPAAQEDDTIANLNEQGFTADGRRRAPAVHHATCTPRTRSWPANPRRSRPSPGSTARRWGPAAARRSSTRR